VTPGATTRTAPSHGVPGVENLSWWQWVLGGVGIAASVVGMNRLVTGPSFVEKITFVNSSPYDIDVDVTDRERAGWLQLGEVEDRAATVVEDVIVQGDVWIVRLADGEGGELRITREELQRAGWRIQIPATVEARLRLALGPPDLLID
jgi:hypothetical protein